jgi:hypothetical protein
MLHALSGTLVLLAVALGTVPALAQIHDSDRGNEQPPAPHFSARDVRGNYAFTCTGTVSGMPYAQLGSGSCDGVDTCRATGFTNQDGVKVTSTFVGKFTVDSDGLGFVTYDISVGGEVVAQLPIQFVVLNGGREIWGLPIAPGFSVLCDLKKQ